MDKLGKLINFTNEEGEVITLLDGKITLSQVLIIIVGIIVCALCVKLIKGICKYGIIFGLVCLVLIELNITSPTDLGNLANIIKESGIEAYQSYVEQSENLKIEDDKLMVLVKDKWIDITDIDTMVDSVEGKTIVVDGESFVIADKTVNALLDK